MVLTLESLLNISNELFLQVEHLNHVFCQQEVSSFSLLFTFVILHHFELIQLILVVREELLLEIFGEIFHKEGGLSEGILNEKNLLEAHLGELAQLILLVIARMPDDNVGKQHEEPQAKERQEETDDRQYRGAHTTDLLQNITNTDVVQCVLPFCELVVDVGNHVGSVDLTRGHERHSQVFVEQGLAGPVNSLVVVALEGNADTQDGALDFAILLHEVGRGQLEAHRLHL